MRIAILLIASFGIALGQQQPAEPVPTGVLSGRVLNSLTQEPIKKATVEIRSMSPSKGGQMPGATTLTTDASGYFQAQQLIDGKYSIRALHPAYPQTRQGLPPNEMNEASVGGSTPTKDIVISLLPGGSVSGKVSDLDGEAIGGSVQLVERNPFAGPQKYTVAGGSNLDETGAFRLSNVPPGRYFLIVRPQKGYVQPHGLMTTADLAKRPKLDYVPVYYPNSATPEGAEPILVAAGTALNGVEIRVSPVQTVSVSGKLALAASGSPGLERAYLRLSTRYADGRVDMMPMASAAAQTNGTFTLSSVPKGSYSLELASETPERAYYAKQQIEVGSESIADLNVSVGQSVDVPMNLTIEAKAQTVPSAKSEIGAQQAAIFVRPVSFSGNLIMPRLVKIEGNKYELRHLTPGKYQLTAIGGYVKSIRWGDREMRGSILEVTGSENGPIEVAVSHSYGDLRGSVQDYKGAPRTVVILIPEADDLAGIMGSQPMGAVMTNGQFQLQAPPGVYYAVCLEGVGIQALMTPEIRDWLRQRSVRVSVELGTPISPIVSILRREAIEQALKEVMEKSAH